jgi:hypothetical protein
MVIYEWKILKYGRTYCVTWKWKVLTINNVSSTYFKPHLSLCKFEENIISCKLGISTRWVNYISNLLNGISNANIITNRAVSVEVRNAANIWWDNCTNIWWSEGSDDGYEE